MTKMTTAGISISEKLLKRVKHAAIDEETTVSEQIRKLLRDWLEELEEEERNE